MDNYVIDFTISDFISGLIIQILRDNFTINSIVQTPLGGGQVRTQMILIDNKA